LNGSTTQAGLPLNGPEAKASIIHWRMAAFKQSRPGRPNERVLTFGALALSIMNGL
jgi:hypothetical protein